jgi:hypothetical protein
MAGGAGFFVDDPGADSVVGEGERGKHSNWPGADDQCVNFSFMRHIVFLSVKSLALLGR